jgi:hypothetical protein
MGTVMVPGTTSAQFIPLPHLCLRSGRLAPAGRAYRPERGAGRHVRERASTSSAR